ncbi:hypothetical protein L1987_11733 [Smallanthus sonchifolius]|uniref:Uncharacterized protein n=1 Tax=Smallanthus sonchifolius TaxID=185202 RepID=A0ACB9JDA9_9ASTR|nr:hypothetical protein L1987_11733 [Smallanthus sonchifolius]
MILGVGKIASQEEIKRACHKLVTRLHPDKELGDEDAKEKFQHLHEVISILGDEEKRGLQLARIGYQFDYVSDWIMLKYPRIGATSRDRASEKNDLQILSGNAGQNVGTSAARPGRTSGDI